MLLRSERDKLESESNFAKERLKNLTKQLEDQRNETNDVLARNMEYSQLIVDYQRKLEESSGSLHAAQEVSRRLSVEVSLLKHEKEMLENAEKTASVNAHSLAEKVYSLQQEARAAQRKKQDEYVKQVEEIKEKDAQIEEIKRLLSEKQKTVSKLEQDLSNCKAELTERERRINDFITGKRYEAEISVEQTMKEKDTRIQALEKHLERKKDELMMERKGHQAEKQMYLTKDELCNQFLQESERFSLELKNVKKASELLFDELEKVNKDKHSLPEIKVYQEKLQKALLSVFSEFGVLVRADAT